MDTSIESLWTRSKLLVKSGIIAIMILLLLIPTYSVQSLIREREARQREAVAEVSGKWAGPQRITGPILALPYLHTTTDSVGKTFVTKHTSYLLPDNLDVQARVIPQERSRGIYKVILYTSQLQLSGSFEGLPIAQMKIAPEKVLWDEAYLKMDIADVRGLNEELKMTWNDSLLTLAPLRMTGAMEGLVAPVPLNADGVLKKFSFAANLDINGSEELLFTPLGKATSVHVAAPWPHPSFTGSMLPQTSRITDTAFTATWKSLAHKRPFAQHWIDAGFTDAQLAGAAFGVDLFVPVNGYQKTLRSVKYAALCIVLTFAAFFLIETNHKRSVHPFQYGLIGLALVLFYMLLLSISEYTGFDTAYAIASIATITLIGWFVKGVLASGKLSGLLSILLLLVYSYVFTILQLQDFALLLGSVGLFISLAAIMYFSKRWHW
jgi:inner membrane protein